MTRPATQHVGAAPRPGCAQPPGGEGVAGDVLAGPRPAGLDVVFSYIAALQHACRAAVCT